MSTPLNPVQFLIVALAGIALKIYVEFANHLSHQLSPINTFLNGLNGFKIPL